MRRSRLLPLLIGVLALTAPLSAQGVRVTFAWDSDPSYDADVAWEVDANGDLLFCEDAAPTADEWRCHVSVAPGQYAFRLRGVRIAEGLVGEWSNAVTHSVQPGSPPGAFTIGWHYVPPLSVPPEPSESAMARRTGTSVVINASGGNGSASVTVPADATGVIAFTVHWDGNTGSTLASLSLGGSPFTIRDQVGEGHSADHNGVAVATLPSPATGTQTLAWTWSAGGARSDGGEIVLVWVRDINPADFFRDAEISTNVAANDVSITLSTQPGDLVLALANTYADPPGGNPMASGNVWDNNLGPLNGHIWDLTEVRASGTSTTVTMQGENYAALVGIAIKPGTPSSAQYVTATSSISSTGGASSLTFAFPNASGAADKLVVGVAGWDGNGNAPTGVTFNGVSLTPINNTLSNADGNFVRAFQLDNPPAVNANVVVTFDGTVDESAAVAIGLKGVDEVGTIASATSTGSTITNTSLNVSSQAGAIVLGLIYANTAPKSNGGTPLADISPVGGSTDSWVHAQMRVATGASTTVAWTHAATYRIAMGFALLPAAASVTHQAEGELAVPGLTMSASVVVARIASAALTAPSSELSAAAAVTRAASGALNAPVPTLAAAGAVARTATGDLQTGVPSLEASVEPGARMVSAALTVPAVTLDATATITRSVAGALEVGAVQLAAETSVARTASGDLVLPPVELSGATARVIEATGDLMTPLPRLEAAVSIVRFANGDLVLAVPILQAIAEGEEVTVAGALVVPMPVLDAETVIRRTAAGSLEIAGLVLEGEVAKASSVSGVILLRPPTLAAQAAIARLAQGDLDAPTLALQARAVVGALQPVMLTRATARSLTTPRAAQSLTTPRTARPL